MSRSVNEVRLLGRIGRDAETKFTSNGVAKTEFSIATSERYKDKSGEYKETTDWHKVVAWRQENISQFLTKGKPVFVAGKLKTRSYDDKDGRKVYVTEVVADEVILLGGKEDAPKPAAKPVSAPTAPSSAPADEEDPCPF